MNIYIVEGFFKDGQFGFKIDKFPVIEYKEGELIKYQDRCWVTSEFPPSLDKFRKGLLSSEEPSVSIHTLDKRKVEQFKTEIIDMIRKDLRKRKSLIESQIEILSSLNIK